MDELIQTVAEASVAFAKLEMANWLPPHLHEQTWETIKDLTVGAITAFADAKQNWYEVPQPSAN